jgi:choline monooxygenase
MRTFYDSFQTREKNNGRNKKPAKAPLNNHSAGPGGAGISINNDITAAETLPASFYKSNELFELAKEKIFAQSWQLVECGDHVQLSGSAFPFSMLPGFLNEPLVLIRNNESLSCFSNVCTHRGNILVQHPGKYKKLICDYHGRRFTTEGRFESMPEFTEARNFPRACEDLHSVPVSEWQQFPFISLEPAFDFSQVAEVMDKYVGFMPIDQFRYAPEYAKDYLVNAHWALYCDNYLEGFHIPFVHPDLNKVLDYKSYETTLFEYCNLQTGVGNSGADCFTLPQGHIDYGRNISAYYFWIYPNMMFNFYPWGLSINIVKPLSASQSKVSFLTYIFDENRFDKGAGAMLDKVEREDEFVVEHVQQGIQSRFYTSGRFSPSREKGVHHFHSLISRFITG